MIKTYIDRMLVSIGIPTYNRPVLLRRALKQLTTQTYKKLEIIVSDNASPGNETANVVAELMAHDSRISYFRQKKNLGAHNNFFFVFEKAKGEFYMWAADDDQWEPWFVERCVEILMQIPERVAAISEVQYIGTEYPYPFFSQDTAFYNNVQHNNKRDALQYLLDHNYDNLIYSVFKRDALTLNGTLFWNSYGQTSCNEIPALLYATLKGGFIVLPQVGMYKEVPENVYMQAMWESVGGTFPQGRCIIRSMQSIWETWKYHMAVLKDIRKSIVLLPIDTDVKNAVLSHAKFNLFKHFFWMLIGYKPESSNVITEKPSMIINH